MKKIALLTVTLFISLLVMNFFKTHEVEQSEELDLPREKTTIKPKPKPLVKKVQKTKVKKKKSSNQKSLELKKVVKMPANSRLGKRSGKEYDTKEFVYMGDNNNVYVESIVVDGDDAVSFGDILVGETEEILKRVEKGGPVDINKPVKWTEGKVPYLIHEDLNDSKELIREAMDIIEDASGKRVQFFERKNQENYLDFKKGNDNCYSYVGMRGGAQKVSLSLHCGVHEILHELVHAIGFFHEQNRSDRDEYIEVHFYNIDEKYHPQFKKIPNTWQHLFGTAFDFDSVMLYPPSAFSMYEGDYSMTTIEGDPYSKTSEYLSETDVERIILLYEKE